MNFYSNVASDSRRNATFKIDIRMILRKLSGNFKLYPVNNSFHRIFYAPVSLGSKREHICSDVDGVWSEHSEGHATITSRQAFPEWTEFSFS